MYDMIDPALRCPGQLNKGQDAASHPVLTLRRHRPGVPKVLSERWPSSLCTKAPRGWSPEKGCGLKNKEEGREGLTGSQDTYLPCLWHIPNFGLGPASCRSPPVDV